MAIDVRWYDDTHEIILMRFSELWTWEEFYTAKSEVDSLIDTVDSPVTVVMDTPPHIVMPKNVLSRARHMFIQRHPRAERFLMIAPNMFLRSLLGVLIQLTPGAAGVIQVLLTAEQVEAELRVRSTV